MQIIFTGSGEFGVPTLAALLEAGQEIVAVCTQPDRPAGRGRKLTPTAISQFASARSLHLIPTGDVNAEHLPSADLMIVIAFGQKIAPAIVAHPRLGAVNLHASILPKYRGACADQLGDPLNGETKTGNSIIRLAQKMDAGNILAQSSLSIGEMETAGELHDRLAADGAKLMLRTVDDLLAGKVNEVVQDEARATLAAKLSRQIAAIDWTSSANEISRKIRGLYPWPGCRVRLLDAAGNERARLTFARARAVEGEGPRWHPGEITTHGHVTCADEAIELIEIQPDDKRPMSLSDYRRGNPWMPGMKLESI